MKTTAFRSCLCALAALAFCFAGVALGDEKTSDTLFSAARYLDHVKYLSKDELRGRDTGSPEIAVAADYLVEQFKAAGLTPAGVDGTWFQPFEVRQRKLLIDEKASITISGVEREWQLRKDWVPLPFCKPGDIEGPLAFAGYGISAPDFEYDDYADFDAEGKVLLILRNEPPAEDEDAEFGGKAASRHAWFRTKARLAEDNGAAALLVVNPPGREPEDDRLYDFAFWNTQQTYPVPIVHISRKMADALLEHAGMPGLEATTEQINKEHKPRSADMNGMTVKIDTGIQYVQGRNVLARLKGDGGSEDTIVIGAHYDHVGVQPPRGEPGAAPEIHNGADDNASGTTGLIELSRVLAAEPKLKRDILFIAFAGEELGLLGSQHYVRHPTVELEHIRAMLNLDMIGRLRNDTYDLYGIGTAKEFADVVERAAEKVSIKYNDAAAIPGGSDHMPFQQKGIPVLFAFTGLHKDYHRPGDDWDLINPQGAVEILQMFHDIIRELGDMTEGPTPAEKEKKESEDPHANVERPDQPGDRRDSPRDPMRVRLGVMPDYTGGEDDKPGMPIDSVIEGRAAAKGGMKDGDRILEIGEHKIGDIYDYMDAMKVLKPGDKVEVIVDRKGEQVTLTIELEAPPRRSEDG